MRQLDFDQRFGLVELIHGRDHGKHQPQFTAARCAQQRPYLAAQQAGTIEPEPNGAPAQRRIFLFDIAQVRQHLVAADVERSEGHRFFPGGLEH